MATENSLNVILSERVNTHAVKYLMSKPKAWWKSVLNTNVDRKFEVEYKKATDYLKGQLDGTGIKRTYKFADGKNFGRQFDHSGLQGMQKCVRGVLCDGIISDLDIVNCHPNILSWICKQNDIPCKVRRRPLLSFERKKKRTLAAAHAR